MKTIVTVGVFGALLVAVIFIALYLWDLAGTEVDISTQGIIAIIVGAAGTLALGVGLMFLLFYSARHGYDEAVDDRTTKDGERGRHTEHRRGGSWTSYDDPPSNRNGSNRNGSG